MAVRDGVNAAMTANTAVLEHPARLRSSSRFRTALRDVLIVVVAGALPLMVGWSGQIALLTTLLALLALSAVRGFTGRNAKALQFGLAYVAMWMAFHDTRAIADGMSWAESTMLRVWEFERFVFGGELLNARLQRWFYSDGQIHLWECALTGVYFSFFMTSLIVGVVVARRDWSRAVHFFIAKAIALTFGFVVIFALPTSPPWLTPDSALDPSSSSAARVFRITVISLGQTDQYAFAADHNPIAAMSSIHMATTCLVLLLVWPYGRLWRVLAGAYLLAMGFTLL